VVVAVDVASLVSTLRAVNATLSELIVSEGGVLRAYILDSSGKVIGYIEALVGRLDGGL